MKQQLLSVKNISGSVVWSSSDGSVAGVSNEGLVTAYAPGTAVITAKAGNEKLTCTVTVENAFSDGEIYTLKVANSESSVSLCELYLETLCSEMTEASGGRLQFQFYPGGSLLMPTEAPDGVKDGSADMC